MFRCYRTGLPQKERTFSVYRSAGGWSQTWALQMGGPGRGALGSRGGNARPCHIGLRMRGGRAHGCSPRRQQVREGETCARGRGERRGRKGSGGEGEPDVDEEGGDMIGIRGGRERERRRGDCLAREEEGRDGWKMVGVGCV